MVRSFWQSRGVGTVAGLALGLAVLTGCRPTGRRALLEGDRLLQSGKSSEAMPLLERAASDLPGEAPVWNLLGRAYHENGRSTDAQKAYRKALDLDRNLFEVQYNLGHLSLESGQWREAEAAFRTWLNAVTNSGPEAAIAWRGLGLAQFQQRNLNEAEKSFGTALRIDAKDAESWNVVGLIRWQRKLYRDAFATFAHAARLSPNYAAPRLNAAVIAHQFLNDRKTALEYYRAYLALGPADAAAITQVINQLEGGSPPTPNPSPSPAPTPTTAPETAPPGTAPNPRPAATTTPATMTNPAPTAAVGPRFHPPPLSETTAGPKPAGTEPITKPTSARPPTPAPSRVEPVATSTPAPAPPAVVPTAAASPAATDRSAPPIVRTEPRTEPPATTPVPEALPPAPRLEVVQVGNGIRLQPARDSLPPPPKTVSVSTATETAPTPAVPELPPASVPNPAPVADLATSPNSGETPTADASATGEPEKPKSGFWSKANPVNWFKRDRSASPTSSSPSTKRPTPLDLPSVSEGSAGASTLTVAPSPAGAPTPTSTSTPKSGPLPVATVKPTPPVAATPAAAPAPAPASVPVPAPKPVMAHYSRQFTAAPAAGNRVAAETDFQRAVAAHRQLDYGVAVAAYQQAVAADPAYFEAQHNLALAALARGEVPVALRAAEAATLLRPADVSAHYQFAVALQRSRYPAEAAVELETVAQLQQTNAAAHYAAATLYANDLQEPDRARPHFERVLALEPGHPQAGSIRRWLQSRK